MPLARVARACRLGRRAPISTAPPLARSTLRCVPRRRRHLLLKKFTSTSELWSRGPSHSIPAASTCSSVAACHNIAQPLWLAAFLPPIQALSAME